MPRGRNPHLVPPYSNHRAAAKDDVVPRSILFRVVYGTLEYGAVYHPSTALVAAREDSYFMPTPKLVLVCHTGRLTIGSMTLQWAPVRSSRPSSGSWQRSLDYNTVTINYGKEL